MIRELLSISMLFIALPIFCLGQEVSSNEYDEMLKTLLKRDVPEIDVAIASRELDDYIVLDAREKREYLISHLPNARWVGYSNFDVSKIKDIDRSAKILVYCSVGARSENVTRKLVESKYKNVHNMYGGIFEWVNQGHPLVDDNGMETERIHAFEKMWVPWLTRGTKVLEASE